MSELTLESEDVILGESYQKERALGKLIDFAQQSDEEGFICDDVKEYANVEFKNDKSWGGVFQKAACQGHIYNTMTLRRVNDPTSHNRPQSVWKSVKFK